jgi:hypothetical protein
MHCIKCGHIFKVDEKMHLVSGAAICEACFKCPGGCSRVVVQADGTFKCLVCGTVRKAN